MSSIPIRFHRLTQAQQTEVTDDFERRLELNRRYGFEDNQNVPQWYLDLRAQRQQQQQQANAFSPPPQVLQNWPNTAENETEKSPDEPVPDACASEPIAVKQTRLPDKDLKKVLKIRLALERAKAGESLDTGSTNRSDMVIFDEMFAESLSLEEDSNLEEKMAKNGKSKKTAAEAVEAFGEICKNKYMESKSM